MSSRGLARHGKKRDNNEREIIATWEAMGAYVESISGKGSPDTLVHHNGRLYRAEVKGAKRGLTKAQVDGFTRAHAAGCSTFIVRSPRDAELMLVTKFHAGTEYLLPWEPNDGALAGASRKERPFRPGTDRARSLSETCKAEGCATLAVPGTNPPRCAAHAAEETFAPPIRIQGTDFGQPSRVLMTLGDKTVEVTGLSNDEIAKEDARLINEGKPVVVVADAGAPLHVVREPGRGQIRRKP